MLIFNGGIINKGLFEYCLLLKIENRKHYSKIIFKCVNSFVGPNFNLTFTKIRTYGHVNNTQDPHKKQ